MQIEYWLEDESGKMVSQVVDIEIEEQASIKELIEKLHEKIGVSMYTELIVDKENIKIYLSHYVKVSPDEHGWGGIDDSSRMIKDFPKFGTNGLLSIYIENGPGLGN